MATPANVERSTSATHVFEALLELCEDVPEEHVVLVDLPDVALLVGEDAQEELAVAVGHVGLRHHDVVARRQSEERHHFARHRVVGHVQRLLWGGRGKVTISFNRCLGTAKWASGLDSTIYISKLWWLGKVA